MPPEHVYVPPMTTPLMTAEQLLKVDFPNKRTELVRGHLIVRELPGGRHARVAMNLTTRLGIHVEHERAGQLFGAGFTLFRAPDTVRAPDVAFVRRERVPDPIPLGYLEFAPDLVVDVLSPRDRPGEILAKVAQWLEGGVRLVWVIDPQRRVARIYRFDGTESVIDEKGVLNGEDVLPRFSCPLTTIL